MVYVRACPESKEPSISPNPILPKHTRKLAHSFSKDSCSRTWAVLKHQALLWGMLKRGSLLLFHSVSHVWLSATPWTVALQAPLSVGILLPWTLGCVTISSPGYLPDMEIEPGSPALAGGFLTTEPAGKPKTWISVLPMQSFCFSDSEVAPK